MSRLSHNPALRILGLILGYLFVCWVCWLVFSTMVTYFFVKNHSNLQDVGDIVRSNQILTYGIAAALFVVLLQILHPLTTTNWKDVFPPSRFRTFFSMGLITGIALAFALLVGTTLGGHYAFLGFYIKFDEVVISFLSILFFTVSVFMLCTVEEFLIRDRFETFLQARTPAAISHRWQPYFVAGCSMFVYLFMKSAQFSLEPIEALNFALLSLCLSKIKKETGSFVASAGFATGFFTLCHSLCSLPLLGQDVTGVILVRATSDKGLGALLSGGNQGPENGIVASILLLIFYLQKRLQLHTPK